jgi:hypothetical protein
MKMAARCARIVNETGKIMAEVWIVNSSKIQKPKFFNMGK